MRDLLTRIPGVSRFPRHAALVAIAALVLARAESAAAIFPEPVYEVIAPGVAAASVEGETQHLVFHLVKLDLKRPEIKLGAIKAKGKETLAQMAQRLVGEKIPLLVAINGDYFERSSAIGLPWGAHIDRGVVYFSPTGKSAFLVDAQGKPLIERAELKLGIQVEGAGAVYQKVVSVNRPRASLENGFCIYTPVWGATVAVPVGGMAIVAKGGPLALREVIKGSIADLAMGNTEIAIPQDGFVVTHGDRTSKVLKRAKIGGPIALRGELAPNAVEAVGGGPRLVRGGKVSVEFREETFAASHSAYISGRHPRSAIGYNKTRDLLILCVVEGRTAESQGLDMSSLARLMLDLGASDAMAFDGGGSAGLIVAGKLMMQSRPGITVEERQLGNALGVFYESRSSP